jgi:hypothetical protein
MNRFFTLVLLILVSSRSYGQLDSLSQQLNLPLHDYLELNLRVLALEITTGIYAPFDMGNVGLPVAIDINQRSKIRFRITGAINSKLPKADQERFITHRMQIVSAGVWMLMSRFPETRFDSKRDLIGFWYLPNTDIACAGWRNETFEWIQLKQPETSDPFNLW